MAGPFLPGVPANDRAAAPLDRANSLVTGTFAAVGPGKAFPVWGPMNLLLYGVQAEALTTTLNSASATVPNGTTQQVGDSIQSTLVPPGTTVLTTTGAGSITMAFPVQTFHGVLDGSATVKFPAGLPPGLQGGTLASLVGSTVFSPHGYFGAAGTTVMAVGADGLSLQLAAAPTVSATASPPRSAFLKDPVDLEFKLTANCVTAAGTDASATFVGSQTALTGQTYIVERSMDGGSTWVGCNLGGSGTLAKFVAPANTLSLAFGDPEAGSLYRLNCILFSAVTRVTPTYRWSTTGQAGIVLQSPAIS